MRDQTAETPADPVERLLQEVGGSVTHDASAQEPASLWIGWRAAGLALFSAVVVAAALWWPQPSVGLGPGITLTPGAVVEAVGTALVVRSGEVRFTRDAETRPRFVSVELPAFDAELIPVGTVFEVDVGRAQAVLRVIEGQVAVEVAGVPQHLVSSGGELRLEAGTDVGQVAAPSAPAPTPMPNPTSDAPRIAFVAVAGGEVPAILVLLETHTAPLDANHLDALVNAAEQIGSARALVPLARQLQSRRVEPPLDALVHFATGRDLEANGLLGDALTAYERVPDGHWTAGASRLRAGKIMAQLGEYDAAQVLLRASIAAGGSTAAAAALALGDAQMRDGDPSQAMWTWRKAKVPSAFSDQMQMKTKRMSVERLYATWTRELAITEDLLADEGAWKRALYETDGTSAVVRARLLADPAVVEVLAEHAAIEEVQAALSTSLKPELAAALDAARRNHATAAEHATRRSLTELAAEIRRVLSR